MKEGNADTKDKTNSTSEVRHKQTKKVDDTTLSNEELFEQIVTKKKVKKSTSESRKKTSAKKAVKKKVVVQNEMSSDDIYEMIKAKKKKTTNKVTKKDLPILKDEVDKKINKTTSKNIKENDKSKNDLKELSSDELYEYIKSKKKKGSSKKKSETNDEVKDKKHSVIEETDSKIKDDLIITREITFDEEKLDLKDKKVLKDLRAAIEEFDSLDDTAEVHIVEEQEVQPKKFKLRYLVMAGVLLVIIIIGGLYFIFNREEVVLEEKPATEPKEVIIDERPQLYQDCLIEPLSEEERTEEIILAEQELNNYIANNYKASVIYEDLTYGYKYAYNESKIYYAASTIKALDALYIYTKAADGEIDLNETMKYSSKYRTGASKEMDKHKYGDMIPLRDLVKYAVVVSDNTAHEMLVNYIGRSNLKEFGKSLGAQYTLYGSDNFGHITASDAIIYMKAINDFINNNAELGSELMSYFLMAEQNSLELPELGISAGHKYGEYAPYYHDIGIVYDENPYIIAILSTEKSGDFQAKLADINSKVFELHELYYKNKEQICYTQIYGN